MKKSKNTEAELKKALIIKQGKRLVLSLCGKIAGILLK